MQLCLQSSSDKPVRIEDLCTHDFLNLLYDFQYGPLPALLEEIRQQDRERATVIALSVVQIWKDARDDALAQEQAAASQAGKPYQLHQALLASHSITDTQRARKLPDVMTAFMPAT